MTSVFDSLNTDLAKFCGNESKNLEEEYKKMLAKVVENKSELKWRRKFVLVLFDDKNPVEMNEQKVN